MEDFKKEAAREALRRIQPGSIIGLGAGSTIAHLVRFIKEEAGLSDSLKVASSSFATRQILHQEGFTLLEMERTSRVDVYFDGCDQFDCRLNALKSGGGIHTDEKILAAMADLFVLLGDATKRVERLDSTYPLVLEVIPEALAYVSDRVQRFFQPVRSEMRLGGKKDGPVMTSRGNFLIDCWFSRFPEPIMINERMVSIPGILEHSLFYNMAHEAIVSGEDGVRHYSRMGP
ncbi:MAG TPA: ribose 5-phosphate isomerase A [Puia sp.]|nr:ribose 5-phosphate isomerase A [Puia sp.]